ncbi:MAG: histidinol dehydrogenase [Candidatus Lindowbacteria bacterium]|nr:histidinol dehydrogenase [Candidatus Lindowbacteria bacterium]
MRTIETTKTSSSRLDELLFGKRSEGQLSKIEDSVRSIVNAVRREGDRAVARLTKKYDLVVLRPADFEISATAIRSAHKSLPANSLRALQKAHTRIVAFHRKRLRKSWLSRSANGAFLGQKLSPIERVGVYCPGGKAFYPSSVLMNIAPAKVAGCREIIMVSPPSGPGGTIHPALLAAARIAGATRVFRIGGAQAVAALAYGTKTIPKVDKIVGPGNIYVTLAKRLVTNEVAIDMEAGPSEIVILADSTASARLVAADLLSQAEHDEMAASILVTTSRELVSETLREIESQSKTLERRGIICESLNRNGLAIVARNMQEAIDIVNRRAPEHLELLVRDPHDMLRKIRNAGVVFLGKQTPNAVGDYLAGPNHVLPTGGRARFSSPLTAEDFRKVTNVVGYSNKKLRLDAENIIAIAELEGFTAHANAIKVRLEK